jgi:hypothetical protein
MTWAGAAGFYYTSNTSKHKVMPDGELAVKLFAGLRLGSRELFFV